MKKGTCVRLMMGSATVQGVRNVKGVGTVLDVEYVSGQFKGRRATVPKTLAVPQEDSEDNDDAAVRD